MPKKAAVEILVINPDPALHRDHKSVHENLWIKQRIEQYVSIDVYLDGSNLKYYFFKDYDHAPKIYTSLVELKQDLPEGLENIFDNTPKLFIMGHGDGGIYGLCNNWQDPSEVIHGDNFDKIITDFEAVLPEEHDEKIFITLEACNTDNQENACKCCDGYTCTKLNSTTRETTDLGRGAKNWR